MYQSFYRQFRFFIIFIRYVGYCDVWNLPLKIKLKLWVFYRNKIICRQGWNFNLKRGTTNFMRCDISSTRDNNLGNTFTNMIFQHGYNGRHFIIYFNIKLRTVLSTLFLLFFSTQAIYLNKVVIDIAFVTTMCLVECKMYTNLGRASKWRETTI